MNEPLHDKTIGIFGFGAMGGALARGLLAAGAVTAERLLCADPLQESLAGAAAADGIRLTGDNAEVAAFGDVLILAVKPHYVAAVLEEIGSRARPEQLVVSVAAGVRIADIEARLPNGVPVVRAMPNSGALVRAGACAIAGGTHATGEDMESAAAIFSAVGTVVTVPEDLLDAVTALSGSGPAYVYLFLEALIDGGVKAGLPRGIARDLAVQTVLGAATVAQTTGRHPAELKDMVTTPAGTTMAGLAALEEAGLRSALITAVEKAAERSRELGAK